MRDADTIPTGVEERARVRAAIRRTKGQPLFSVMLFYEAFLEGAALAANQCHAGYGDEYGNHRCKEIDARDAEIDRLRAENARLIEALNDIAAWDFKDANEHLARTGSYVMFEERNSVEVARAALSNEEGEHIKRDEAPL